MRNQKMALVSMMFMLGASSMRAGTEANIWNNTLDPLYIALVKTKVGLKGFTHPRNELYDTDIAINTILVAPGGELVVQVPEKNVTEYDRVLYVVHASSAAAFEGLQQSLVKGKIRAKNINALELGSKTNVVIRGSANKYTLVNWSTKWQRELDEKWNITKKLLQEAGAQAERVVSALQTTATKAQTELGKLKGAASKRWGTFSSDFKKKWQDFRGKVRVRAEKAGLVGPRGEGEYPGGGHEVYRSMEEEQVEGMPPLERIS